MMGESGNLVKPGKLKAPPVFFLLQFHDYLMMLCNLKYYTALWQNAAIRSIGISQTEPTMK